MVNILYSFRRCPYAMRARLAIAYSQQPVALREVVLKNKPQALLASSAKGTVPVLVLEDGSVLDESLDIMVWALEKSDPDAWLNADLLKQHPRQAEALLSGRLALIFSIAISFADRLLRFATVRCASNAA